MKWIKRGFLIAVLLMTFVAPSGFAYPASPLDMAPDSPGWNPLTELSSPVLPQSLPAGTEDYISWVYALYESINQLRVKDLNLDGWADVAFVTNQHRLQVWLQNPVCHALQPLVDLSVAVEPRDLDIGDFNADGWPDIAVIGVTAYTGNAGEDPSAIQIFFQTASGFTPRDVFIPTGTGYPTRGAIKVGDVTGDGLPDLVSASAEHVLEVNVGQPDGSFTLQVYPDPPLGIGQYTGDLAIDDFNGDGRQDVALQMATNSADNLILYFQDAATGELHDGVYVSSIPGVDGMSFSGEMTAGDVTGDGRADLMSLVAANMPSSSIVLYRQLSGGAFSAPEVLRTYELPTAPNLGDMNADGRLDLVVLNSGYGSLTIHFQLPEGGLGPAVTYIEVGNIQASAGLGDVNGDGALDVVCSAGGLAVLSTGAQPNCPVEVETTAPAIRPFLAYGMLPLAEDLEASELVAGDVDNDGLEDFLALVSKDFAKTYVQVIRQVQPDQFAYAGKIPIGEVFPDPDLLFIGLSAGDLNNDGRLDVAAASTVGEWAKVAVVLQAVDGNFLAPMLLDTNPNPQRTFIADWTGDGLDDLGVIADGGFQVFPQQPGGALASPVLHLNGQLGATPLAAARDWNLDGRMDLITWWRDYTWPLDITQEPLRVFLQEPSGDFTLATSRKFISGAEPAVGDLNSDGRPDIIIPDSSSNYMGVFYQLPDGSLSERVAIGQSTVKYPGATLVTDLNFDQHNDLLVFNTGGNPLGVFTQNSAHNLDLPVFYDLITWNSPYINASAAIDNNQDGAPETIGFASPDFYLLLLKPLPAHLLYLPQVTQDEAAWR